MKVQRGGMGCCGWVIFTGIFMLVGLGLSYWGWTIYRDAQVSQSWPSVSGEILSSSVGVHSDDDGTSYSADVAYTYVVNDQMHSNDNVNFGQLNSSRRYAQNIVDRYSPGMVVDVYYDPADATRSVLEPGVSWTSYFVLGMGLFFTILPLLAVSFTLMVRGTLR